MNNMNQMTPIEPAGADHQAVGYGRYGVQVSILEGVLRLTLRHVGNRMAPIGLFGHVVLTKMVRLAQPGQFSGTLTNGRDGLIYDHQSAKGQTREVILDASWPINVREHARRLIDERVHGGNAAVSFRLSGVTAAVGGLAILLLVAAAVGTGKPSVASEPQAAPEAALLTPAEIDAMSSAVVATKAVEEHGTGMERVAAFGQANRIQLRAAAAGRPALIVWSDPLCPNCRDFEQNVLAKLPANIGLTVVPVSFKEGSRPLVSYASCGTTDSQRAARWNNLMASKPNTDEFASQCKDGPGVADANSILFARAGLTATPTLMSTDGRVFAGDRNSVEAIATWLVN